MKTRVWVALALVVSALSACSNGIEELGGGGAAHNAVLETIDWAVNDGMLSVRVRNDTDRVLNHANVQVSVSSSGGKTISAPTTISDDPCCTILSLPPDHEFGLYVDVSAVSNDISRVDVRYSNISWQADDSQPATELKPGKASLEGGDDGAVVTVPVRTVGEPVEVASGQAFLTDADGRLVAVVSGRFNCFAQGQDRTLTMELFHAVPAGTRVDQVVTFPLPDDTSPGSVSRCPGS